MKIRRRIIFFAALALLAALISTGRCERFLFSHEANRGKYYATFEAMKESFDKKRSRKRAVILPDDLQGFSAYSYYMYPTYFRGYEIQNLRSDKYPGIITGLLRCNKNLHPDILDSGEFNIAYKEIPIIYTSEDATDESNSPPLVERNGESAFVYHIKYLFDMINDRYELTVSIIIPSERADEFDSAKIAEEIDNACFKIVKNIIDKGVDYQK
ncbi:MAG: hypothetical protein LBU32_24535 [Clostridiales bacterium]|nr:hypothetical protein [Clostridiales bacterium]